jgi:hypothetical protein
LLIERIITNSGDSLTGRFGHETFPFEVDSARVDIPSKTTRIEVAKMIAQQLEIHVNAEF